MTVNVFKHGRHYTMEHMKVEWEQGVTAITPEDGHAKRGFLMSNGYVVSWYGDQTEAAKLPPFCIPNQSNSTDDPTNTTDDHSDHPDHQIKDDELESIIHNKFQRIMPDIEGMIEKQVKDAVLEALKTAFGKLAE